MSRGQTGILHDCRPPTVISHCPASHPSSPRTPTGWKASAILGEGLLWLSPSFSCVPFFPCLRGTQSVPPVEARVSRWEVGAKEEELSASQAGLGAPWQPE